MKEKLIELFNEMGTGTEKFEPFIMAYEFEELADKVIKLFAIPDVRNSVCSCNPNTKLYSKTITFCKKCNKEVKFLRTN